VPAPLISGKNLHDVALTGPGTIDGSGAHWWAWSERAARNATANESRETYYDLLAPLSPRLDLWETEYLHVMADPDAILEWIRATSLRPFLDALASADARSAFESQLRGRIDAAFPIRADGKRLFPFMRLFFVACV